MPEDEAAAAAQPTAQTPPCAGCRILRRRCVPGCIFAPYFPGEGGDGDEPSRRFAAVHRVFGASNAARMLADVELPDDRRRAAETLVEEAMARVRDPAFGLVSLHAVLLMRNQEARGQVVALREEIARELGADAAAAEAVDVAAASPEVKMEAKAMVDRALADARKLDAELLARRSAVDLEWWQKQCPQAAKRAAAGEEGRRRRVSGEQMEGAEDMVATAGESSSKKTVLTSQAAALHGGVERGIPERYKQSDALKEEEEALVSEQDMAADELLLQRHDSAATELGGAGTSSYLDVAAAAELAKQLDAMINRVPAAQQQYDDDPAAAAAAGCASLGGLDVAPPLQQPPQLRDVADMAQQIAEVQAAAAAAAEQSFLIQLLAKQHDVKSDTELDITLGQDMHQQMTEVQLVAAAFSAGEVSGEQVLTEEMMMMQYAQMVQAPLAGEHGIMPAELAAAQLAREQALLITERTKQHEKEMRLLLEAVAAAAQYASTELDVSPEHHQQTTVQQMLQEQQMVDAMQVAMEPSTTTTTMQQQGAEHGCATVAFQSPESGEAAPFLVGQQPPPEGQAATASALGVQLDSSLLPSLGETTAQVPPQQQQQQHHQSTDSDDEGQDSDFTGLL
ncbi:hypothetical protein HU200_028139 [Digitaria exilis]|uniref:LOB domain-containing protein n=1 Tax=Digitaria exilis TaxID=1010633 RepID=A0A835BX32_9POAL|nr:hypothetical protein HU200_028139 [Digitaria exilis]